MGRAKDRNSKKSFMREHDCRFCLYYGSCAHKECMLDGSGGDEREGGDVRPDGSEHDARDAEAI